MASVLDTLAGNGPKTQKTEYGVQVIPYDASNDKQSDMFLPWFWQKLKDDGLVSLYYPGQEECGFSNFVKLMSGGSKVVLAVVNNVDGPESLMGFASWDEVPFGVSRTAIAGFIFLKDFWDQKHTVDAANAIMDHWVHQEKLDAVIGLVADKNVLAERFMQKIGWKRCGDIPLLHQYKGEACGATIWAMTREGI